MVQGRRLGLVTMLSECSVMCRRLAYLHIQHGLTDLSERCDAISRAQALIWLQMLRSNYQHIHTVKTTDDRRHVTPHLQSCNLKDLKHTANQQTGWPQTESWDTSDDEYVDESISQSYASNCLNGLNDLSDDLSINVHSKSFNCRSDPKFGSSSDVTDRLNKNSYNDNVEQFENDSFSMEREMTTHDHTNEVREYFKSHQKMCENEVSPSNHRKTCKLFVKNITFEVTSRELKDFFCDFGQVTFCKVLTKEMKGRRRSIGCGHVTFSSPEEAQRALYAPQHLLCLDGRYLVVEPLRPRKPVAKKRSMQEDLDGSHDDAEDHVIFVQPTDHQGTHILCLNEDVMMTIFSFLSIKQKIQVERVCKRWRHLSIKSWVSIHALHFRNLFSGFGGLTDKILRSMLQKTSVKMQSLDLSSSPFLVTDKSFKNIAKYCPQLTRLNLSGSGVSNAGLKAMAESCLNLQWIKLTRCNNVGEKGFWALFHKCKSLRYVNLEENRRLTGQCFHVMCGNVESLMLNECYQMTDLGVEKLALRSVSLKELHLTNCSNLTDASLRVISQQLKTVSQLHFGGLHRSVSSSGLQQIGQLSQMSVLNLAFNVKVDDLVLTALAYGCKMLRCLDISGCHQGVTNDGIHALSVLNCLCDLNISYIHLVYDDGLEAIARKGQLECLTACGCGGFTDQAMTSVASLCDQLREVDVSGCFQLTNATLRAFVTLSCIRPACDPLLLVMGGTGADPSALDLGSGVKVSMHDRSASWRRGDFGIMSHIALSSDEEEEDEYADLEQGFEGGGCGMSMDLAEAYLDADDPSMMDEWDLS